MRPYDTSIHITISPGVPEHLLIFAQVYVLRFLYLSVYLGHVHLVHYDLLGPSGISRRVTIDYSIDQINQPN